MPAGFASKVILLHRKSSIFIFDFKIDKFYSHALCSRKRYGKKYQKNGTAEARGSNFIEEAFAEAAAVIAEALRKPSRT